MDKNIKESMVVIYGQEWTSILFGPNGELTDYLPFVNEIVYTREKGAKFNFDRDDLTGAYRINLVELEVYSVNK